MSPRQPRYRRYIADPYTTRACINCQILHIKCIKLSTIDNCEDCMSQSKSYTFKRPKKRGPRPGYKLDPEYIENNQKKIEKIIQEAQEKEKTKTNNYLFEEHLSEIQQAVETKQYYLFEEYLYSLKQKKQAL
ncbi:7173_t:CDS:1 [Ambispora leptoticha]|uniref:7173_t:CDS:1 n=1 Tax=Ambispora leptoticha TaxID=144679 RepID=A0A9N9GUB6_9GLOM|nr:7173_t:CDS:1 [Ambispora leptoticha]